MIVILKKIIEEEFKLVIIFVKVEVYMLIDNLYVLLNSGFLYGLMWFMYFVIRKICEIYFGCVLVYFIFGGL